MWSAGFFTRMHYSSILLISVFRYKAHSSRMSPLLLPNALRNSACKHTFRLLATLSCRRSCWVVKASEGTSTCRQNLLSWDAAPCSLVEINRRFRGVHCWALLIALMTEAVSTSEVIFYETTRRNIAEDSHLLSSVAPSSSLLWKWQWTSAFHKRWGIYWLAAGLISFSRGALILVVSLNGKFIQVVYFLNTCHP
jgi:hypothetical protein